MIEDGYEIWGDLHDTWRMYRTLDRQDAIDTYAWMFADDPTFDLVRIYRRDTRSLRTFDYVFPTRGDDPVLAVPDEEAP